MIGRWMRSTLTRFAVLALVAAVVLVAGTSAASAGEKKGPPGPDGATGGDTPIGAAPFDDRHAASICSFSGLNDAIPGDGPFPEYTQTQSYGTFLNMFQDEPFNMTFEEVKAMLPSPGQACNPNTPPPPEE